MALQGFTDYIGPAVTAAFLNNVDQAVNGSVAYQIDASANFKIGTKFFPSTPAGATQTTGGGLYQGSGVPTGGGSGDFYLRTDTPGTANQRLYVNNAGTWTAIL